MMIQEKVRTCVLNSDVCPQLGRAGTIIRRPSALTFALASAFDLPGCPRLAAYGEPTIHKAEPWFAYHGRGSPTMDKAEPCRSEVVDGARQRQSRSGRRGRGPDRTQASVNWR